MNIHNLAAAVLCAAFALALSGCQANVITAPHATFMVDSVTCPVATEEAPKAAQ